MRKELSYPQYHGRLLEGLIVSEVVESYSDENCSNRPNLGENSGSVMTISIIIVPIQHKIIMPDPYLTFK